MRKAQDVQPNNSLQSGGQSAYSDSVSPKNAVTLLGEELRMTEEQLGMFIAQHMTQLQHDTMLGIDIPHDRYNEIKLDVLNAIKLTDQQMIELAHILDISDEMVNAFAADPKVALEPLPARRMLVDLYRYQIMFNPTNKSMFYCQNYKVLGQFDLSKLITRNKAYILARTDAGTLKGYKSFSVLRQIYPINQNTEVLSQSIKNIFMYLLRKYRFANAPIPSANDISSKAGAKAGKSRLIGGSFINITKTEEVAKLMDCISRKQQGSGIPQIMDARGRIDQAGDLTPENAAIYARAYVDAYSTAFWKMVAILNQLGQQVSLSYHVGMFIDTLRSNYKVPEVLLNAYMQNGDYYATQLLAFFTQKASNPESSEQVKYTEEQWNNLMYNECVRLHLIQSADIYPVLESKKRPADFIGDNNNANINENKNSDDESKKPANLSQSFGTTHPKISSHALSGEAMLLLYHFGIRRDMSSGIFIHKKKPINVDNLSEQPGYRKAHRTFQKHSPYADSNMLKSDMHTHGPEYVLSYILYMDSHPNPATTETYTIYQAEMDATSTFMSGGIRENQKLVKNFDLDNQMKLFENKRRDFTSNHQKDKLLDPDLYAEMFIRKYVDLLHEQLYAVFKGENRSSLDPLNETSDAKMKALHAYMKNNPSDFERLKNKVFAFLETAYLTNQYKDYKDRGSQPLEKEPVNETDPLFGPVPKGPVRFFGPHNTDFSQHAVTRDTPKFK